MAELLGRLEHGIESRRGAALLFLVALAVYGLQSIALPVVPGRDFGTYLRFYVQMFEWDSVLPMSMLFRTPLAPLLVGGSLDLAGGYATQALMAALYATSIVCWTRTALAFGRRAALVTAAALLLYPGYGILFHMLSSDSICAFVFALWALALTRAFLEPTTGRFALLGLATAAAALTRPGYQVLAVFALLPLVLGIPWRRRLVASAAFLGVVVGLLGVWTVNNGLRYDDYALARGGGAFFPFYRAFVTDRIVSPENGEASQRARRRGQYESARRGAVPLVRDHARAVLRGRRPARVRGRRRDHGSRLGLGDGLRADARGGHRGGQDAPVAIRAGRRRHGPRRALEPPARCAPARGLRRDGACWHRVGRARSRDFRLRPRGSRSLRLDRGSSRRRRTARSRRSGRLRRITRWSSRPPKRQRRFEELEAESGRLSAHVPPYPGSAWLTLQFSRSSKLFPPPLLWLGVGIVAWLWRRPARGSLAAALAGAALVVVSFQALAIYSIIEFAVPVAPALIVFGAAGLVGVRRASAV